MNPTLQDEIEKQRPYLLRIARLQLRNKSVAEDVVQDTLIAALEGQDRFAGKSAVRTWLVGILKHKIIDQIRRGSREVALVVDVADGQEGDFDALFDEAGHFADVPREWGDPERTLEQKRFYEVLQLCLDGLSPNLARIFMMREFLGLETEEICKDLQITPTNCWVMLYRARMRLRACLEQRWFQGSVASTPQEEADRMVFIRTCKEVHRLVAESMDRKAGIIERAAVRLHLAICESCRRFTRQIAFLREAIRRYPGDDDRR